MDRDEAGQDRVLGLQEDPAGRRSPAGGAEGAAVKRYVAAGGVVTDGDRVLVLRRPSRGEVRLPKGHVEPGESAEAAAIREVGEESGYVALRVVADLGRQLVEFDKDGVRYQREERYFLMEAITNIAPVAPEAQFEPHWLDWAAVEDALTFAAEREWVRRAFEHPKRVRRHRDGSV